ncbi:MAG: hypothetical protein Q4F18_00700 [Clostridia bacterium]|nr:hypothetical protein [Clostridia bacterium]
MPNTVLETRVRAAYRAQACAAAISVGAMVFSMGAGIAITICLNAAYISALSVLPVTALTALACRRSLRRQAERSGQQRAESGGLSRALCVLLALTLVACAIFCLAALVNLAEQSLLRQARMTWIAALSLLAAGLCALSGGTGISRLGFMLRWILPVGLLVLCAQGLTLESHAGLFPLLGRGTSQLGLSALAMLGGAAPVLMLMLPPPALREAGEEAQRCPVPGPGFFMGRVLAGAVVGIVLLVVLALCNSYESLRTLQNWGERMFILCCNEPREGIFQSLLTLLQITAMMIGAVSMICAAEQALVRAWPGLGAHRMGLALCLVLCGAAFYALIRFGFIIALSCAPFLLIPLAVCLLGSGRM